LRVALGAGMLGEMGQGPTEHDGPARAEASADALAQTMLGPGGDETEGGVHPEADTQELKTERIGRYRVVAPLGAGGMGLVHLAHDDELERPVALKVLRPGGGGDPRRLLREARSMARLSHPHIAAVFDVGTHDDDVYVAMEYVQGPTLRDFMEQAHTWARRREVLVQAAQGLAAAHEQGVVHRDFKPENVIVGEDGRVRVLDFGLAKLAPRADTSGSLSTDTQLGTIVGTPRYMAPEQLRAREAGPAADQFAFCVTAYELAYRQRPFDGEVFADVAAAVLTRAPREPPAVPDVPSALWPVLRRGMQLDPDARYPDMQALTEAVEQVPGAVGASVVSRPALRDAREDARRRLTDAYADDLLDGDELDQRLEALESAAQLPAVAALVADLAPLPASLPARTAPAGVASAAGSAGASGGALVVAGGSSPAVIEPVSTRRSIAVFSGSRRAGVWAPARVNQVFAMFGGCEFDLREARLPAGELEFRVFAMFGGVTIIVPPGVHVQLDCTAIMGATEQDDAVELPEPGATVVRVTGFVMFGGVTVIERLPGESGRAAKKRRKALRERKQARALPPKR